MRSLIEQAAERLEQLRQAGVFVEENRLPSQTPATQSLEAAGLADQIPLEDIAPSAQSVASPIISLDADLPQWRESGTSSKAQRIEFDLAALAKASVITPNAPRSHVADEFRVVKRPLLVNARAKGTNAPAHANLIMVTSAVAGEGKSFTSVNLAMSIAAELDHTVMLVDADLARPSLPRMLGVDEGPGLLDLLDGTAQVSDVLLRTNVEKLTLLRSGTPHPRATELLASKAMQRLLDDLSKRYSDRIIIFDSPPLLLTTEARTLAMYMGQVVFVVRADKTLQSAVQNALATIEACPVKMMLLNQTRVEKQSGYGEYGLGYGYAYGYGNGAKGNGS